MFTFSSVHYWLGMNQVEMYGLVVWCLVSVALSNGSVGFRRLVESGVVWPKTSRSAS
jgi:hypothetical protein